MRKLLIKNIESLVQVREKDPGTLKGSAMGELPSISNAWLAADDGIISAYGSMDEFPGITDWSGLDVIDAEEGTLLPTFCDSHTHLVYAGNREGEFVDRIRGLSYEEIAKRGGGILNSANKLRAASEDELFEQTLERFNEVISLGTGAIEIKSGYGLDLESELKMLRVIRRLKELGRIPVKATFLGAHAVPAEFKNNKDGYIKLLIDEMMPAIAKEKLAEYCDIFCERNYFTPEDTIRILEAGKKNGMTPKVHANQLSHSGGVQAGVKCGAISVDHLEFLDDEDISALKNSSTIPTLLPGAQFFLGLQHPPARKMIDAGLPVAVASDFNPGSCPSGNMMQMVSLCCINYRMTPEEAFNAATINSAAAMDVSRTHGSITVGKTASFILTKKISSLGFLPYSFGSHLIDKVIVAGKVN
ncbi:MAG TPA: imidazolonepropionase [Bacteroidia bacterium]|jgi:imidazolonepropionase|nr:imidazolonepropionase [Bacteroidia bacterium]